jgi:hypothetical protein
VLVVLGLIVSAIELAHSPYVRPGALLDARGMICVGQAANAGRDPYATEPERTCEHAIGVSAVSDDPQAVMGFALPGYLVPPLGLLARLPLDDALVVFLALAVTALAAAIVVLVRAFRVPPALATAALAFAVGFPTLSLGQLGTFVLLTVVATAAALHTRRNALAGLLGATTLVEPHVGVFVGLALLVWVPRARATFLAGTLALVALAVAATGLSSQLQLVLHDLRFVALAELHQGQQYSAAYLAAWFGASPNAAVDVGAASTAVMLGVGVWLAGAWRTREPGGIALLPAACATLGGAYIHSTQIGVAIPAALVLVPLVRTRTERALVMVALVLLAIPWFDAALVKQLLPLTLTTLAVLVWSLTGGSWARTAVAVAACWLVLLPIENHPPPAPVPPPRVASAPGDLPSAQTWLLIHGNDRSDLWHLLVKVPTWLGLLALVIAAGAMAWPSDRKRDAARPSLARGPAAGTPSTGIR